jgi:hypothetical protein
MPDTDNSRTSGLDTSIVSHPSAPVKASRPGRSKKKRKFYEMDEGVRASPAGLQLTNEKKVLPPRGGIYYQTPEGRRGFPEYAEMPILRFDHRLGHEVKDMEWNGSVFTGWCPIRPKRFLNR